MSSQNSNNTSTATQERVLRCWLCDSDRHQAGRCEKKCRGAECARLGLRVHSWSECPKKTKPFCLLCGETGHGVFASKCIHRCFAHKNEYHLMSECPTRCKACGARGHDDRSRACSLRRDRRPMSLIEVASFKRVVPVEPSAPVQASQPAKQNARQAQPTAERKAVSSKKQAQQPPKQNAQQAQPKKQERSTPAADATKEKEAQMKKALEELEREKARILKELEQLQKAESPVKAVAKMPSQVGRKALKQSRG